MRSAPSNAAALVGVLTLTLLAGPIVGGCSSWTAGSPTVIRSSPITVPTTATIPVPTTATIPVTTAPATTTTTPTTTTAESTAPSTTLDPTTTVPATDVLALTVIGDSYSTGWPTADGASVVNWPDFVVSDLHANGIDTQLTLAAQNGTGYLAGRETGETFLDRVAGSVTPETEMVILLGSRNDGVVLLEPDGAEQLRAAATATYSAIRAIAPDATLIVIGAPWVNEAVPAEIVAIRDVLRDVAGQFGAVFVDPIEEQWFFGEDARFISGDQVHPTVEGHEYMAGLIVPTVFAATIRPARPPSLPRHP